MIEKLKAVVAEKQSKESTQIHAGQERNRKGDGGEDGAGRDGGAKSGDEVVDAGCGEGFSGGGSGVSCG